MKLISFLLLVSGTFSLFLSSMMYGDIGITGMIDSLWRIALGHRVLNRFKKNQ